MLLTIKNAMNWFFYPPNTAPDVTVLIRLMAGGVFLSEGVLKFVYPNQGVGRFTKLGLPFAELTANLIGTLEIVGGLLLIVGLLTRVLSLVFIIEMVVAILTTKISLFYGTSPLPMPPAPPQLGFWAVLHETRSDYAQIMTCFFLLIVGPGRLAFDRLTFPKATGTSPPELSSPDLSIG